MNLELSKEVLDLSEKVEKEIEKELKKVMNFVLKIQKKYLMLL